MKTWLVIGISLMLFCGVVGYATWRMMPEVYAGQLIFETEREYKDFEAMVMEECDSYKITTDQPPFTVGDVVRTVNFKVTVPHGTSFPYGDRDRVNAVARAVLPVSLLFLMGTGVAAYITRGEEEIDDHALLIIGDVLGATTDEEDEYMARLLTVTIRANDTWVACRPRWDDTLVEVVNKGLAWRGEVISATRGEGTTGESEITA